MSTKKNKRMAEKHWKWIVSATKWVFFQSFNAEAFRREHLQMFDFFQVLRFWDVIHKVESTAWNCHCYWQFLHLSYQQKKGMWQKKKWLFIVQLRFCNYVKCVLQVFKYREVVFTKLQVTSGAFCDIWNWDIYFFLYNLERKKCLDGLWKLLRPLTSGSWASVEFFMEKYRTSCRFSHIHTNSGTNIQPLKPLCTISKSFARSLI